MTDAFARSMEITHRAEGGFVDHPADRGGPTNWGFSLGFLRRIGFDADGDGDTDIDDVRLMTQDQARLLFRLHFWEPSRAALLPWPVCLLVFDAAVHHGQFRSILMLQQAINRQMGRLVAEDGLIGRKTIGAVQLVDKAQLVRDMLYIRRAYMRAIVAADPTQEVNLKGWLNRVEELESAAEFDGPMIVGDGA